MEKRCSKITITDIVFFAMLVLFFLVPEHPVLYLVANALAGAFCLLVFLERMGEFKLYAIAGCYGVFAFLCFFSYFYSADPQATMTRVFSAVILFFLLCAGINYFSRGEQLDKFVQMYIAVALISCLYIVLRENIFSGEAVGGTISNTNQVGTRLAFAAVLMLFSLLRRVKWWKFLLLGVLVTFVILSASRSSAMILVLSSALLLILTFRVKKKSVGAALLIITALVLLFIFLVFNVELFYQVIGVRIEGVLSLVRGDTGDSSSEKRLSLMRYGWTLFREHPLFGQGIGSFAANTKQAVGFLAYSHNNYLELLTGVGLFGTLVYYAVPFSLTLSSLRLMRADPRGAAVGALCFALMTGLFISDFFTVNYYSKTAILLWIYVAAAQIRYPGERREAVPASVL